MYGDEDFDKDNAPENEMEGMHEVGEDEEEEYEEGDFERPELDDESF